MAFKKLLFSRNPRSLYFSTHKYEYEIPWEYKNSFFMANASLVDNTNWFVHNAVRVLYNEILGDLEKKGSDIMEAADTITNVLNIMEPCSSFIEVQFPIKQKNGLYETFTGFRAEHGCHITKRPCLGGLRLCPNIDEADIKALASISTYKHACMGINMLGAHGGISVCPKTLNPEELQNLIEKYTAEMTKKTFCGEGVDIFEPDMNCGSEEIKWVVAAHAKIRGSLGNACAMGKPTFFGGICNREKVVAQGILFGLDTFLQNEDIMAKIGLETGWANKTFVIQGLGNVGSYTGRYLEYAGLTCTGIVEHDCHIFNKNGVNIEQATRYKRANGSLDGFQGLTKNTESSQVLTADCDVLIVSATQKCLLYYIADKIKAKIVVEAANAPIAPSTHQILLGRKKLVLPDIYINAGSSVASYFEYLKNIQHLPVKVLETESTNTYENLLKFKQISVDLKDCNRLRRKILLDNWEKSEVTGVLDNLMHKTALDLIHTVNKYNLGLDFRTAAYIKAVKKLFWLGHEKITEN